MGRKPNPSGDPNQFKLPLDWQLNEAIAKIRRLQNVPALQRDLHPDLIEGVMELLERVAIMSDDRINSYARKAALAARCDRRRVVSEPTILRWAKVAESLGVLFVDRQALRLGGHRPNLWRILWDGVDALVAPQTPQAAGESGGITGVSRGYHGATPRGITALPPTKGRFPRKKSKADRRNRSSDLSPLDLSSVDWDRVRWDFDRLCRKIPAKTDDDRRAWLRYVVLSHTACSEDWLADSIQAVVNAKEPSENPRARLVAVLIRKVVENEWFTREAFLDLCAGIEIPYEVWKESAAECAQ